MNNCERYEDLCSLYVDGALTAAEETELANHLKECPACAEYLEELKIINNGFKEFDTNPPEDLHEKIMTAVCNEVSSRTVQYRQPKFRAPMFTMIGAAAAAVILVMSGVLGDIVNKNHGIIEPQEEMAMPKEESSAVNKADMDSEGNTESQNDAVQQNNAEAYGAVEGKASLEKAAPRAFMVAPSANADSSAQESASVNAAPPPDNNESDPEAESEIEEAIVIPASVANESYAFCVIAKGTENIPEIDGTLISGDLGGNIAFFTVSNSMTLLEKLMDKLSKSGFEPAIDKSNLVPQDKNADMGLIILIKK